MKLSIEAGHWILVSDDNRVYIRIRPRRSAGVEGTRVDIRLEPMPLASMEPEAESGAAATEHWIWSGEPADAQRIIGMILPLLQRKYDPGRAGSPRAAKWRGQLLASLFGGERRSEREEVPGKNAAS